MSPAEAARFEALARDSRDVRRLYLRTMNMVSSLPHYVASHEWILGDEKDDSKVAAKPSMGEAMVLPALREQDMADEEPAPMRLPELPRAIPVPAPSPWRRIAVAAAVGAVITGLSAWALLRQGTPGPVVVQIPATQPLTPPPVVPPVVPKLDPVRLTAVAGVTWANGAAIAPGTVLEPGRKVAFDVGAVEVLFGTGSHMVVEGPAAFRVTDENHASLDYGKLVARVPPSGHGFGVSFGDRMVTDLGTEFGLSADPQHDATVAVFDGQVVLDQAPTPASSTQPATRPAAPVHLTQGDVVATTEKHPDWAPATPTAVHFARTLADVRVPLPGLSATGLGLKDGQPDPHWMVYNASTGDALAKPAAMTTTGPPSSTFWVANDPTRSQWLSTAGGLPNVGAGTFVFRTTVDLTGFDPATAVVQADVMADDALNDVRVNGVSVGLSLPLSSDRSNWRQFHRLSVKNAFKAGRNTVEFVVYNGSAKMGFRAELHGDAVPLPVR